MHTTNTVRLSKKRKAKFDKIRNDASLDPAQKESLISQFEQEAFSNKRQKRSQMEDFKDSCNFVANEKPSSLDNKINSSSLWGLGEKNFLEDVTLNLIGDDDAKKNLKGQTAMKWDKVKKKYVLMKVDRDGKVIAEKRNESGAKITKKMKEKAKTKESIYKKWQQKTHLSLQKSGEVEDNKTMDQAKRANEARKTLKEFKLRHGQDLYKGEDARSHKTLIDKKTQKLMNKTRDDKPKGATGKGR